MNTRFVPSLLVPEIYFPVKFEKRFTLNLLKKMADEGFYRSFEIGDVQEKEERKGILILKEKYNFQLTQWFTFLIDEYHLDVSSINTELRKKSVNMIKESIYSAAECGAANIAFVPGQDPGDEKRQEATEGFFESLCEICEEASNYNINVLVEHLDRFANKNRLIGPMDETVHLLSRVGKEYKNIGLAFDTAHSALNGESIPEALEMAQDHVHQIHLSNAVLDKKSPLFGDFHMPIGEPGFLNVEKISAYLQKADELGIHPKSGLRVAIEVRGKDEENYQENERTTRMILENALNLVKIN